MIGQTIHGFARGIFGRDSYACRIVEAEGVDWIVTRNEKGQTEMVNKSDLAGVDPDDRSYCSEDCRVIPEYPHMRQGIDD